MDNKYKVFLILKGKGEISRVPLYTFLAKDYKLAEIYFRGFITDLDNPQDYTLYKIGEINEKKEIEPCKIFITGGYEATHSYKYQKKLEINGLQKAMDKHEKKEIIKELFNGTEIK